MKWKQESREKKGEGGDKGIHVWWRKIKRKEKEKEKKGNVWPVERNKGKIQFSYYNIFTINFK